MIKSINYLAAVLLLSVSCHRDDGNHLVAPKIDVPFKISTIQDLSSLQVGDKIAIDFEIEDKDTINASYVLKPETRSIINHQRKGIDYLIQVEDYDENKKLKYIEVDDLKLKSREQKGGFYIEILQPSSFKHKYVLEKYVNGRKVGETSAELLFNAVKITAWTYSEQVQRSGLFQHSIHKRYYKFSIDDGIQQYDNYLETANSKSHTYTALYRGQRHSEGDNTFSAHQEKEFRWSEDQEKHPPHIHSTKIEEISIRQKQADGTINNIIYRNIPIEIR